MFGQEFSGYFVRTKSQTFGYLTDVGKISQDTSTLVMKAALQINKDTICTTNSAPALNASVWCAEIIVKSVKAYDGYT